MRKFVMSLVALGFLTAPMLMLQGCGNLATGDTVNSVANDNSGQDNSVYNNYPDGTVLTCTDANCTISTTDDNSDNSVISSDENGTVDEGDAQEAIASGDTVVGVYSDTYNQTECGAAGFFFCTIEQMCLNQPLNSGTCSN